MSTPVGTPPHSRTRANLVRRFHRVTGLCLVLPVCLLVTTGIFLEFTEPLKLGQRGVSSNWVHAAYSVQAPATMRQSGNVVQVGAHLFAGTRTLDVDGQLIGTQALEVLDLAVLTRELLLLPRDAQVPPERSPLPGEALNFGETPEGALVIDTPQGIWLSGDLGASWQPGDILRLSVRWTGSEILNTTPGWRARYGARIISWERLLQDLHSGRLFGTVGVWVMNLAALALLGLAFTGMLVWYRSRRSTARSHTV